MHILAVLFLLDSLSIFFDTILRLSCLHLALTDGQVRPF